MDNDVQPSQLLQLLTNQVFSGKRTENGFYLQIKGDSPQCVSLCGNDITRCVKLNVRENPDIVYFGDCSKISKKKI